jgi:hypothetical protein
MKRKSQPGGDYIEDSCMKMTNFYKEKGADVDEKHQLYRNEIMEHFEQDKTAP